MHSYVVTDVLVRAKFVYMGTCIGKQRIYGTWQREVRNKKYILIYHKQQKLCIKMFIYNEWTNTK